MQHFRTLIRTALFKKKLKLIFFFIIHKAIQYDLILSFTLRVLVYKQCQDKWSDTMLLRMASRGTHVCCKQRSHVSCREFFNRFGIVWKQQDIVSDHLSTVIQAVTFIGLGIKIPANLGLRRNVTQSLFQLIYFVLNRCFSVNPPDLIPDPDNHDRAAGRSALTECA